MSHRVDMDTYRTHNDIGPDDPAPRAPKGEPDERTDDFLVWQFEADASATVPDTYVVAADPNPLAFRMWVFVGRGPEAHFVMRASHKYGDKEVDGSERTDCCEVLLEGESLRGTHCPSSVQRLVRERSEATVVTPDPVDEENPIDY